MLPGMWSFLAAFALMLCGCASYRVLPSPAPAAGPADQLHEQRIAPYPAWLAAGPREMFVGLVARDRKGAAWRETWRDAF